MVMQLMLNDEASIAIPVDDFIREAWELQMDRAVESKVVDKFYDRLAECFASSLAECLDPDLKLPTEAQVRYATDISRDLGIPIPAEVFRFRGAMSEFIERFADRHKNRRHSRSEDKD